MQGSPCNHQDPRIHVKESDTSTQQITAGLVVMFLILWLIGDYGIINAHIWFSFFKIIKFAYKWTDQLFKQSRPRFFIVFGQLTAFTPTPKHPNREPNQIVLTEPNRCEIIVSGGKCDTFS